MPSPLVVLMRKLVEGLVVAECFGGGRRDVVLAIELDDAV